ncbi:FecR family protein [Algibacter miyuki]|uniref:FecR family protein n=1 Tax=Algibacter miyuki TaxID=1306933 RepID=A0ABV5H080_9FLAO|nr:FecR family protein [Algibacter miyuki]
MNKNKILIKKINANLTKEEEKAFQDWLQKSEENKHLYEKLVFLKREKTHIKKVSEIDTNTAWQLVQEKYNKNKFNSTKRISSFKVMKYAVAASIVLLISAGLVYNNRNTSFPASVESAPVIVNNSITAGTDKAILTLEDGTSVELKKDVVYATEEVSSDGKQIVYNSTSTNTKDIKYNYLTIPRGGQFFIKLSDGTQVWLNSETKIKYPVTFTKGIDRQIELIYGEAFFDVTPSEEHQGASFKVYHNRQEIEVLGTQFNIKAYKNETNIYTTLLEGKVAVDIDSNRQYLKPSQQSNYNLNNNSFVITTVDARKEILWKDGVFNFESEKLKDIMVVLSRWYDMDVMFENTELEEQKFVGLINKNYTIEDILTVMKDANIINSYSIIEKIIILK